VDGPSEGAAVAGAIAAPVRRTGKPRVKAAALRSPPLRRKLFPGDFTSDLSLS
jgi:hypothetical protein